MKAFIAVLIFGAICLFAALKISEPQKSPKIDDGLSQSEQGANSEDSDELVFHKLEGGGKKQQAEATVKTNPPKVKCTTDSDCKAKNPNTIVLHEVVLQDENKDPISQLLEHPETASTKTNTEKSPSFTTDNIEQIISEADKTEAKRRAIKEANSDELLDLIDNLSTMQELVDKHMQNNR